MATAQSLLRRCEQIAEHHCRLIIDISGVSACDREGLAMLRELQGGRCGVSTSIVGARWSQFLALLQATPLHALNEVHADIRLLLGHDERRSPAGSAREEPPSVRGSRHSRPRSEQHDSTTLPTS